MKETIIEQIDFNQSPTNYQIRLLSTHALALICLISISFIIFYFLLHVPYLFIISLIVIRLYFNDKNENILYELTKLETTPEGLNLEYLFKDTPTKEFIKWNDLDMNKSSTISSKNSFILNLYKQNEIIASFYNNNNELNYETLKSFYDQLGLLKKYYHK